MVCRALFADGPLKQFLSGPVTMAESSEEEKYHLRVERELQMQSNRTTEAEVRRIAAKRQERDAVKAKEKQEVLSRPSTEIGKESAARAEKVEMEAEEAERTAKKARVELRGQVAGPSQSSQPSHPRDAVSQSSQSSQPSRPSHNPHDPYDRLTILTISRPPHVPHNRLTFLTTSRPSHNPHNLTIPRDVITQAEEEDEGEEGEEGEDGEEDAEEEDKYAKERPIIESLIVDVSGHEWESLKGQSRAKETGRLFVNSINRDYNTKPQQGLLLTGPPGVGKGTLAKTMSSQMNCTFFKVPPGFAKGKVELWPALFEIAKEKSPSIVFIDECDGVMSKRHSAAVPAIKTVWESTSKDGSFVLILGATNKPDLLDDAIHSRFGPPIPFIPLDAEARREILESMKAPCNLSDEDWKTLSERLDGWNGRQIEILFTSVALKVENDGAEEGRTTPRPILLSDFETQLAAQVVTVDSIMSPEAKAMFIRDWCCKIFCARIDDKTGSDQRVISLRYMIESFLSDSQLKSLGAKDIKQLRTNPKYSIKTQESTFLDALAACFQEAFKDDDGKSMVEIIDNNTAREKTFVARVEQKNGSGQLAGYATTETKAKTRGYYFANLRFKTRL